MLAQNNEAMNECVNTMAQLSEDEQIRMQCEARKDNLAIEKGLYNRGYRQGQQEGQHLGELRGKVLTYAEFGLNLEEISEKVSIPVDEVKQILSTKQAVIEAGIVSNNNKNRILELTKEVLPGRISILILPDRIFILQIYVNMELYMNIFVEKCCELL